MLVLQVLEARIDHTRVVQIVARADHMPLVKDYLMAVQKARAPPWSLHAGRSYAEHWGCRCTSSAGMFQEWHGCSG